MSAASAVPVESKSAKKRKAKAETATTASPAGRVSPTEDAGINGHSVDSSEPSYLKELNKNIRNLHKKLAASAKADSVIEQNPDVPLDELVAQKKLNADQKAQIVKKPQLQAQLAQLEEQQKHYQTFAQELLEKFDKEKAALIESHEAALAEAKQEATELAATNNQGDDTEKILTVITGFLHAAAAKRQSEDQESDEAKAFEGALLLVYQGNDQSLNTLKSLVEGSEEKVVDVEGNTLDYSFAQIKEAALKDAAALVDEPESATAVDEVSEAPASVSEPITDPTIAHAGLTELEDTNTIAVSRNGDAEAEIENVAPEQTSAGDEAANAVAEQAWDPQASITSAQTATGDDFVMVARDPAETENASSVPAVQQSTTNWADETAAEEKAAAPENDGFEQVKRERGRGRGGSRGGRGFEGRGRGRGRGEYRGRGGPGRGRGRGDRAPQAAPAPQAS